MHRKKHICLAVSTKMQFYKCRKCHKELGHKTLKAEKEQLKARMLDEKKGLTLK